MNLTDIVLILLLVGGGLSGYRKGLFHEAASLFGLVLGAYLAVIAAQVSGRVMEGMVNWNLLPIKVVTFLVVFSLITFLFWVVGASLTRLFKALMINFFNRLMGVIFGVMKTSMLISLLVFFMRMLDEHFSFFPVRWFENSTVFESLEGLAPWLLGRLF